LYRTGKTLPIDGRERSPEVHEQAVAAVKEELADGNVVCTFPEGRLTPDGEIGEFRAGVEKMLADSPVPVIPMALQGLWGSYFSHQGGRALAKLPKRLRARVALIVGAPQPPETVRAAALRDQVQQLRGDHA